MFWKLAVWAFKATWGITKVLVSFVFCPVVLFLFAGLLIAGVIYMALPLLIVGGIVALASGRKQRLS